MCLPAPGQHARNFPVFSEKAFRDVLYNHQIFLLLEHHLHSELIRFFIRLRPRRPYRRALRPVQHFKVNAGRIRGNRHLAAKGVDLPHNMALCKSADCGIAAHLANRINISREQQR